MFVFIIVNEIGYAYALQKAQYCFFSLSSMNRRRRGAKVKGKYVRLRRIGLHFHVQQAYKERIKGRNPERLDRIVFLRNDRQLMVQLQLMERMLMPTRRILPFIRMGMDNRYPVHHVNVRKRDNPAIIKYKDNG